jgi:hypothetical protein
MNPFSEEVTVLVRRFSREKAQSAQNRTWAFLSKFFLGFALPWPKWFAGCDEIPGARTALSDSFVCLGD